MNSLLAVPVVCRVAATAATSILTEKIGGPFNAGDEEALVALRRPGGDRDRQRLPLRAGPRAGRGPRAPAHRPRDARRLGPGTRLRQHQGAGGARIPPPGPHRPRPRNTSTSSPRRRAASTATCGSRSSTCARAHPEEKGLIDGDHRLRCSAGATQTGIEVELLLPPAIALARTSIASFCVSCKKRSATCANIRRRPRCGWWPSWRGRPAFRGGRQRAGLRCSGPAGNAERTIRPQDHGRAGRHHRRDVQTGV